MVRRRRCTMKSLLTVPITDRNTPFRKIDCIHLGYLFNLIYDLSPARLGRGGRRVALISAVHGIRV